MAQPWSTPPCPSCARPMSLIGTAAMIPIKAGVNDSVLMEYVCENFHEEYPARNCGASMALTV